MVSSRGEGKGCFATFVERRLYTALKIQDRTAESMETAITRLVEALPVTA
jgi:IS30 family transposase